MAELADALDLGSNTAKVYGFESRLSYQIVNKRLAKKYEIFASLFRLCIGCNDGVSAVGYM